MKKLGAILLSFTLLFGLFPPLTMAAQNDTFEQELTQFLEEVSEVRGFEVTREDIEAVLSLYEESIEKYESVEELGFFLGEVINSDLSNLDVLYEEFELDEAGLQQLLQENEAELSDYIFLDDLSSAVFTFSEDGVFERDPNFDQDLADYLAKISDERGFEVTKEDVEASLTIYETSLEEFETVEDLSGFLGEVIQEDLSNLDYFSENYELDQETLLQVLAENGKDINDYIYIDDLDQAIWEYYGDELFPGMDEEIAGELLPIFQEELDLTDEELQRIEEYLMSLEEHLSSPETLEKLEELGSRMMEFADFEVADELTAEQIAELTSIYEEFLSIFQLKAEYSLVKDGTEAPLSFLDLLKMEELKGANLKVALFSADGQFLADMIVTGELVDSDTVTDTGKQIEESAEEVTKTVEQPAVVQKEIKEKKAEGIAAKGTGQPLPNTATNNFNLLLGGFVLMAVGGAWLVIRKRRLG